MTNKQRARALADRRYSMQMTGERVLSYVSAVGLTLVDGNDVKVLLALLQIEAAAEVEPGMPFSVRVSQAAEVSGLSPPTVCSARDRLAARGAVVRVDSWKVIVPVMEGRKKFAPSDMSVTERKKLAKIAHDDARESRRPLIRRACVMLGIPPSAMYMSKAMAVAAKRMSEGATEADLMTVVEAQVREWKAGNCWRPAHNLMFLWATSRFSALLGTASTAGKRSGRAHNLPGGEDPAWRSHHAEKARRIQEAS